MDVLSIAVGVIVFSLYLAVKWSLVRNRPGHVSLPRFLAEALILAVVVVVLMHGISATTDSLKSDDHVCCRLL